MANIPLQIASRSLGTGNVVQYPGGGELGRAVQDAGNELSQLAEFAQQKQDQMDRFKRLTVENAFDQAVANQSEDLARNAPADGSGIHDGIVGQIDPTTGAVVKPGLFDNLAQQFRGQVPASQQKFFDASLAAKRLQVSGSAASVQYGQEQKYATLETAKIQDGLINSILQSDPNDAKTFDAYKEQGRATIEASPLAPLAKKAALDAWDQAAPKALAQAITAKDPGKLRAMLGMEPVASTGGNAVEAVTDKIIGVESGGKANAKNPNSSASGVGQFLDSTWVATVRQHRPDIAAGKSAAQIIALKSDAALGREMTKAYTQDNANFLTDRGLATTPGNLYLAHFLGPQGAVEVLKADPNASIASVVGQDVVNANPFLKGMTAADTAQWAAKKMGSASARVAADPRFASLSPDDRISLANADDVAFRQQQAQDLAAAKADYTSYKDRMELAIVAGQVADPAVIMGDKTLNDGDKASLLRSFNEQNKGAIQVAADLSALQSNSLAVDPYSSDDKKRVDNLYSSAGANLPLERRADLATAIIQQTHLPPQSIINDMRRGLSSQNPAQVIAAAQTAQKISTFDPAALGRRDGGSEVQKAADDFSYYVNKLNLSTEEAARRMIDAADPAKQRDRKALEPAAKEFVKTMGEVDLAGELKDGGWGTPALGLDPAQQAGIQADFLSMAEDAFYSTNGDPELAKNRALQEMKAIYGPSQMSGSSTIVKYPPERYWPKQESGGALFGLVGGDPLAYAKVQLYRDIDETTGRGAAGPQQKFDGLLTPGNIDLTNRPQVKNADGSVSTVRSMSYENDAGQEVLIPTVSNEGKVMSDDEAIRYWGEKGQFLGKFDNPDHADAYAEALHEAQDKYYLGGQAIDHSTIRLVTTPETEADVKAGRLPGYAVMWKDANGNLQTMPGKLWRPDTAGMLAVQQQKREKDQAEATSNARQNDQMYNTNILTGEPLPTPSPTTAAPAQSKPDPGANISTDIPAPEATPGSAM